MNEELDLRYYTHFGMLLDIYLVRTDDNVEKKALAFPANESHDHWKQISIHIYPSANQNMEHYIF